MKPLKSRRAKTYSRPLASKSGWAFALPALQRVPLLVLLVWLSEFNDMVNRLTHTVNMNVDAMKADSVQYRTGQDTLSHIKHDRTLNTLHDKKGQGSTGQYSI